MIENLKNCIKSIKALISNDILFALCSVGILLIGLKSIVMLWAILGTDRLAILVATYLLNHVSDITDITKIMPISTGMFFVLFPHISSLYIATFGVLLTCIHSIKICKRAIFKLQAPSLGSVLKKKLQELKKIERKDHLINELKHLKLAIKYDRFKIILWYDTFSIFTRLSDVRELEEVNNEIDELISSVNALNSDTIPSPNPYFTDSGQQGSDPKVESYVDLNLLFVKSMTRFHSVYLIPLFSSLKNILNQLNTPITEIKDTIVCLVKDSSIYLMKYWQLSNLDHASAVIKRHGHLKGCFCPVSNALLTKPLRQRNGLIFQDTGPLNLLNISNYDLKVYLFICDLVKQTQHSEDLSNYQPPKHLNENPEIGSMTEKLPPINCEKIGDNEDAITCPISTSPISDPVVTPDNQTFERESILGWFQTCEINRNPLTSPLTREVFRHDVATNLFQDRRTYQINHAIAKKAEQSTFDAEKAEQSTTAKILSFFGL